MKNPASCLAELNGAIAKRFPGDTLRAGEIIGSGTSPQVIHWKKRTAELEGIPFPSLTKIRMNLVITLPGGLVCWLASQQFVPTS